ncbi:UNVERIFIED_CONTAM: hypothetical protein GTU68_008345 [Idotea baltica]|nr:hypothetical protein [Idotea baltica]
MNQVYIVSAVRTPIGSYGGIFATLSAVDLGVAAVRGALKKANVPVERIEEVLMGNVVSANLGQAPARQIAMGAGISNRVPCTTINKVCASGMKAVMFAAQNIMLGHREIMVAGGAESMSQIPFYVPRARFGYKFGNGTLVDGLVKDGLEDVYDQCAMGTFADSTAIKYDISRDAQDAYAIESYKRSAASTDNGSFRSEIVPVSIPQRKGDPILISEDEEYKKVKFEKIPALRPAFTKDGTVTAANASTINDGASAIILASEKAVKELGLEPVARIVSFADGAHDPSLFTTAPTIATPIALERAGLQKNEIDYYEVNEAFAVVPLAFSKIMDIDKEVINVMGGAVSLGHPLGASGARIISTLSNTLQNKAARYGLATICNGGGGASSMIIERL